MVKELSVINGKQKVIYTKRLIAGDDNPLEFNLMLDDNNKLLLKFSFVMTEAQKPSYKIEQLTVSNGLGYHFILDHFNNPLGTGLINPLTLLTHTVNGVSKDVSITFFVYKNNEAHHILDITLYEEI